MEINWVTVVAQIFNFLLLVWLLHRFLYGPITRTMQQRQEDIAQRLEEARRQGEEAEKQAAEYRSRLNELEQRREEMLRLASSAADDKRESMLAQARREVEQAERRWHQSLEEQRQGFLRELRRRAGEQVCRVARQALQELADADLQAQIIAVFTRRLRELPPEEREALTAAVREGSEVVISSAFELPDAARPQLIATVREALDPAAEPQFVVSPEIICGIELRTGGHKLAWSIDSYLAALRDELADVIAGEVQQE